MFDREFTMAVAGFVKYFMDMAINPEKMLPKQAMATAWFIKFNDQIASEYHLDRSNWYLHGYMQLWYKYFELVYPLNLMR
jgi:hypothetical protein